jgi:glycosyltransferase involved in cell wall biosynthesis
VKGRSRRALKTAEYCANLALVLAVLVLSPPRLVHIQWLPLIGRVPFDKWFTRVLKRLGIPTVYTVHNVLPHERPHRFRGAFRSFYQIPDLLICHTESASLQLRTKIQPATSPIEIIPMGPSFPLPPQTPSTNDWRRELGLPASKQLVLFAGSIRRYKGLDFLLSAWHEVTRLRPEVLLIIVGTGPSAEVRRVSKTIKSLALNRSVTTRFGFLSVEDLTGHYLASDILVYPYRESTQSAALITGMTIGKPIVATRLPAFTETLTEGGALLVDYGDVGRLADALLKALDSADLRRRLGTANLRNAEAHQWRHIAQQTSASYDRVLSRS